MEYSVYLAVLAVILTPLCYAATKQYVALPQDSYIKAYYLGAAVSGYGIVIFSAFWIFFESLSTYPEGLTIWSQVLLLLFALLGAAVATGGSTAKASKTKGQ